MFQAITSYNGESQTLSPRGSPVADRAVRIFEQRHLSVPRTARYAVMGSFDEALSEVWIVCHGHGQLAARFLSRFVPIERGDRLFVAPEALSRYYLQPPRGGPHAPNSPIGATWMTSEDRDCEIADYVGYLDLVYDEVFSRVRRDNVRLCILGFSQGCATVAVDCPREGRSRPRCFVGRRVATRADPQGRRRVVAPRSRDDRARSPG
jgi:hypothetical protein